jgi:hypothetical protein
MLCYVLFRGDYEAPQKILTQFIVQILYINYVNIGYK